MSDMFEKINDLLGTQQGQETISNLMQSLSSEKPQEEAAPGFNPASLLNNLDVLNNIQSVLSSVRQNDTPSAALMSSLRPYLRSSRHGKFDAAMQLLALSKLPSVISSMKRG